MEAAGPAVPSSSPVSSVSGTSSIRRRNSTGSMNGGSGTNNRNISNANGGGGGGGGGGARSSNGFNTTYPVSSEDASAILRMETKAMVRRESIQLHDSMEKLRKANSTPQYVTALSHTHTHARTHTHTHTHTQMRTWNQPPANILHPNTQKQERV